MSNGPAALQNSGANQEGYATIGKVVWHVLTNQPLGSLTKRELELILIRAAVEAGLLTPRAERLAATCHVPISRAHSYLTDLALRKPPLTDVEAVNALVTLLKNSEVVPDATHFSIPVHDAALRIWLERKMAALQLNTGDTLRRDHIKLTAAGLAKLIGSSEGIMSPYDAIRALPPELEHSEWAQAAKKSWKKGMAWSEALGVFGNLVTIGQVVASVLIGRAA